MEGKITDYFKVATDEDLRKAALRPLHRARSAPPPPQGKRPVGRPRKKTLPKSLHVHVDDSSTQGGHRRPESLHGSNEDGPGTSGARDSDSCK